MRDENRPEPAADEYYEKTGYLHQHYRLFHLKDTDSRDYAYHCHDFDKIVYFIGGRVDYMIEGKKYALEPYDFVLVNRNEIHKPIVDFTVPYERFVLYIEHEFLERHQGGGYALTDCFMRTYKESANVVRFPAQMHRQLDETLIRIEENDREESYAGKLYGEVLFLEFMIQMNRACTENACACYAAAKYNRKVLEIIEYVNDHLGEALSIDSLSERFFISRYHMMRQFKKETGYSIHQYITEKRILAARNMILTGMPATVAAVECGFKDYSTFLRAFRKQTGSVPSDSFEQVSRKNT